MIFPKIGPNATMTTANKGLKVNLDVKGYDDRGHLVKSYESVPPGVKSLPMGPRATTVVETPSRYRAGGPKTEGEGKEKEKETTIADFPTYGPGAPNASFFLLNNKELFDAFNRLPEKDKKALVDSVKSQGDAAVEKYGKLKDLDMSLLPGLVAEADLSALKPLRKEAGLSKWKMLGAAEDFAKQQVERRGGPTALVSTIAGMAKPLVMMKDFQNGGPKPVKRGRKRHARSIRQYAHHVEGEPAGSKSSHLMATFEEDGKYYVAPTITTDRRL